MHVQKLMVLAMYWGPGKLLAGVSLLAMSADGVSDHKHNHLGQL